jgi:chemotaxis protein CheD
LRADFDERPLVEETILVGISDLRVTANPAARLVTHALGSCIGLALWDRVNLCGGLLHYMLPRSSLDAANGKERPAMFGDTGIPLLFEQMYALGCQKRDLVVKVAGGGSPLGQGGMFQIGERNVALLRKLLWRNAVLISAEDVGGTMPRTLCLYVATGRVTVTSGHEVRDL